MTKKEARDRMVALIFMTASGRFKDKQTNEKVTLKNLPEKSIFTKTKELLKEKSISRTSVYKAIECKGYFAMDKDTYEIRLKEMHDFVYTYLDK